MTACSRSAATTATIQEQNLMARCVGVAGGGVDGSGVTEADLFDWQLSGGFAQPVGPHAAATRRL